MNINIKLSDKIKNRTLFAKDVAKMFNGEDLVDFPYMPNDNDDSFWTIDMGNDWKIGFNDEDASIFYIMYRYVDIGSIDIGSIDIGTIDVGNIGSDMSSGSFSSFD